MERLPPELQWYIHGLQVQEHKQKVCQELVGRKCTHHKYFLNKSVNCGQAVSGYQNYVAFPQILYHELDSNRFCVANNLNYLCVDQREAIRSLAKDRDLYFDDLQGRNTTFTAKVVNCGSTSY